MCRILVGNKNDDPDRKVTRWFSSKFKNLRILQTMPRNIFFKNVNLAHFFLLFSLIVLRERKFLGTIYIHTSGFVRLEFTPISKVELKGLQV